MRAPGELVELFRERGLKITPQRELVFRILDRNEAHPTAEAVYARARAEMPSISLKTVYQVLNDLEAMGEVQSLDLGTGSSRFDPNVSGHHHLVCRRCGRVRDVHADYVLQVPPGQQDGFEIAAAEVIFRGVCAACSREQDHIQTDNEHNGQEQAHG